MKVGDLITRKARGRLYDEATPPLKTVVRVIKSQEPRLHGKPSFYIALDDDPGRWRSPAIFLLCLVHKVFYSSA